MYRRILVILLAVVVSAAATAHAVVLPTDIPNLALWLDAGAGVTADGSNFVSTWGDQSGNLQDVTAAGTAMPLLVADGGVGVSNLPVLRFERDVVPHAAGGDFLSNTTFPSLPADYTILMVAKTAPNENTAGHHYISGSGARSVMFTLPANQDLSMYAGAVLTNPTPMTDDTFHLVGTEINSTTGDKLFLDGSVTVGDAGNEPLGSALGIWIGADQGGVNSLNGDIAEVLIYSSALSDGDRKSVEDYLALKYFGNVFDTLIPRLAGEYIGNEIGRAGTAFSSGGLIDGGGQWLTSAINNGGTAEDRTDTWIADTVDSTFGINLAAPTTVDHIAWKNEFPGRAAGSYEVQYTTDNVEWNAIGVVSHPDDITFGAYAFEAVENVTGIRMNITGATGGISIGELQVFDTANPNSLARIASGTQGVLGAEAGGSGTAFSSGDLDGIWLAENLNNGVRTQDGAGTWIASATANSQFGITLAAPTTIDHVAWQNTFPGRASGSYELQYTTNDVDWDTIGTIIRGDDLSRGFYQFDPVAGVTGVRMTVLGATGGISVTELEVFGGGNPNNLAKIPNAYGVNIAPAGTAFTSGDLVDGGGPWPAENLNNAVLTPDYAGTWIADTLDPAQFGIMLAEPTTVSRFGWKNPFGGREQGLYELQYTTNDVDWITIGNILNTGDLSRAAYEFDPIAGVTGLRLNVSGLAAEIAVTEFEIYTNPNNMEILETGGALESGATDGEVDVALNANGSEAFAESQTASGNYPPPDLNDGIYGETNAWVALDVPEGGTLDSFAGVILPGPTVVDRIAFSQDNDIGGDGPNAYWRTPDTVELQVTTDDPAAVLADPTTANWTSIGAVVLADTNDQLRRLVQFDPVTGVTAARMVLTGGGPNSPLMDEFEVYARQLVWNGATDDWNSDSWNGENDAEGGEAMSVGGGLVNVGAGVNPASSLVISGGEVQIGAGNTLDIHTQVDIAGGTLSVGSGTLNASRLSNTGTLSVGGGSVNVATLETSGTNDIGAGSALAVTGSLSVDSELDLTGSTLDAATANVTVGPAGTLTLDQPLAAANVEVAGAINANAGASATVSVRILDGGTLNTTDLAAGSLAINGAGTLVTSGVADLSAAQVLISGTSTIRVDGGSLTVAAAESLPVTDGLELWLRASAGVTTVEGGFVTAWEDQSGNGRSITVSGDPTLAFGAIEDQPAVRFDGDGDHLGSVNLPSVDNSLNAFVVLNATPIGDYHNIFDRSFNPPMLWVDNTDTYEMNSGVPSIPRSTTPVGVSQIMQASVNNGTAQIYVNGVQEGLIAEGVTIPDLSSYFLFNRDGGQTFNGDVAEIIFYSKALNEEDRLAIQAHLDEKYFGDGLGGPEYGNLEVAAGATFNNVGDLMISFRSITGSGTVNSNVFVRETLLPGDSAGTLTVTGELEFDDNATFVVEIDGDQHDQVVLEGDGIQFSGTAYLSGTLDVQGIGPMTAAGSPTWGDKTLTVMSRVGESNGAIGDFAVVPTSYGATGTLPLDGDYLGAGIWFGNEGSDGIEYVGRAVPEDAASAVEIGVFQAAPGDTDGNRKVEGQDILNILQAGLFGDGVTTEANWGNGDFNSDSKISGEDILALLGTGLFGDGTYPDSAAAAAGAGVKLVVTGNGLVIDTAGATVTGFVLSSEAGILTGESADNLGLFQEDTDETISGAFAMSLKGEHGLGDVIGETDADLAGDLSLAYTLAGQPGVFTASVVVPEPGTLMLLLGGLASLLIWRRRK